MSSTMETDTPWPDVMFLSCACHLPLGVCVCVCVCLFVCVCVSVCVCVGGASKREDQPLWLSLPSRLEVVSPGIARRSSFRGRPNKSTGSDPPRFKPRAKLGENQARPFSYTRLFVCFLQTWPHSEDAYFRRT